MYVKVKRQKKIYFIFCELSDSVSVIKTEVSKLSDIPVENIELWKKIETTTTTQEQDWKATSRGGFHRLEKSIQEEEIVNGETLYLTFGTDDYTDIEVTPFEH
ncbi:hypothetical protein Gasu2_18320 [Galdieria sulphuraria]|uniref:Ubiquitin-like domain-containing protein n=1 Tax=Galdieria sulphuraria TaxID=130081 RepID=M2XCH3_GALSU|nr:uncharacterized protein Gasu_47820 [Galdieria sulphuraria]EME27637.1 hypothetical protein Gasu_47820 [Galdieria sulphuraria]GJD07472.1 hypothetical protein Gasu2_18320 [Galdieria sulphuraria]|eukprot:XP_005704157.1 hypothetical protein Gasu_47820 [Galdieria sulphuraria]